MAKGPGRICLKPCQEAKGKTEGSLFHVGSAGEDCFLTWFMKTNICEMEPFFFFLPLCHSFSVNGKCIFQALLK